MLVSGYWAIAHMRQRAHRLRVLTQGQNELASMAHALPLVVFRYCQPVQGPGRFTFLGQGLKHSLGVEPAMLENDPEMAWRMAHLARPVPPVDPIEFPVTVERKTRWIRCDSMPSQHQDGAVTYNGYWLDVTDQKQALARSEAVFNHAPMAFLFFDEDLQIIRANAAAIAMFGAASEQALLGLKPTDPPLSRPQDKGSPAATRICSRTRSMPKIASVTGCSTCRRVFISMK